MANPTVERLFQTRQTEDGSWEVLITYGSFGDGWVPLGAYEAAHRFSTLAGATHISVLDLLRLEGWKPPWEHGEAPWPETPSL